MTPSHTTSAARNFYRKTRTGIALVLVAMLIAPSLILGVAPKQAEAQNVGGAEVSVAACLVANLVGAALGAIQNVLAVPVSNAGITATASNSWRLIVKECVLDTLVWALKEMIIQQLMRDVIGWINGGFDGTPGFVTDTGRWFKDLGETFIDEVLWESGITDLLCTPFRADLTLSLYLDLMQPKYQGRGRCTLDDFMDDATFDVAVEQGNADAAGISGVFGLQMKANNPIGSFLSLREEVGDRYKSNVLEPTQNMLAYGNGYISMKCDFDGEPGNEDICTPGDFVKEQLNEHAKGPLKELIEADEFNEIINALVAAFVTEVLNDAEGGLLGRSGDQNYWDGVQDGDTSTDEWCDMFPSEPLCNPTGVPVDPEPPAVDPAQTAQWNALRSCLTSAVGTMLVIVSSWGDGRLFEKAVILTELNSLMADLTAVNTSEPGAGSLLASLQARVNALSDDTGVPVSCGGTTTDPGVPPPPAPPPPDPGTLPPLPTIDPPDLGGGIPLPPGPGPIP